MSLIALLRKGVKIADKATKSLQSVVTLRHYTGSQTLLGDKSYTSAVELRAVVDWEQRQIRTSGGVLSVSRAMVLFLDVAALSAATNAQGVDDEDIITLPDGTTGPILDMGGFIDPGTGRPLATEVYLG